MRSSSIVVLVLLISFLSGCAIKQDIVPVDPSVVAEIDTLYILRNFDEKFDPALEMLEKKLTQKGVNYKVLNSSRPPKGARFHMKYEGEWKWDMGDYLSLFRVSMFKDGRIIGAGEYNAQMGGMRLDKWGDIQTKIEPVLDQFLATF